MSSWCPTIVYGASKFTAVVIERHGLWKSAHDDDVDGNYANKGANEDEADENPSPQSS